MNRIIKFIFFIASILKIHSAYAVVSENACSVEQYTCYPVEETCRGFSTKMEACEELLEIKNSTPGQYLVADIGNSTNKRQTLHFDYDALDRAIFSGLAGVRQSDTVTYVDDTTRAVTNALGKRATYHFADFNGVKRLQSVTGEPAQNCVSSEVTYEYDASGNVSRKIQNGQVTEYQYDSLGREIARTEAAGTPEARTITTEYHPILNLPVRIGGPDRVEVMTIPKGGYWMPK